MGLFSRRSKSTPPAAVNTGGGLSGGPSEALVAKHGIRILDASQRHRGGLLSSGLWQDKLMQWTLKDEAFKVQLFRFVDVFPRLNTPESVHEHLMDYLTQPGVKLPPFLGTAVSAGGLAKGVFRNAVTSQVEAMGKQFIAGVDAESAKKSLSKLWKNGIGFSVDLLGEACVRDAEADVYLQRYLDMIEGLAKIASTWEANERLDRDHIESVPRANVSVKISSLSATLDPIDTEGSIRDLLFKMRPILQAAAKHNVLINFDMESHESKDLTLELVRRACELEDFPAGMAMQAYLRSGSEDAQSMIDWAKATGRRLTVRLVKGAYWDYETIHAEEMGWPVPVWSRKQDSDACFERMAWQFLQSTPRSTDEGGIKLALGSHNARSIGFALASCEHLGLPESALELQMLYGMADELKAASVGEGLRLREYVPVGEMIPGMAYLVRRLLENTSNESWLLAAGSEQPDPNKLLASPHVTNNQPDPGQVLLADAPERHQLTEGVEGVGDDRPYVNEAPRDFAHASVRSAFQKAIDTTTVPHQPVDATKNDGERALAAAHEAFPRWRDENPRVRAAVLTKAAAIMRSRRDELTAVIVHENGKGWRDADAETCEAIDFCEFYAREAIGLFEEQRLGEYVGEHNALTHEGRGPCAVIAPWNFPLAILCGMSVAALVTGNPVIMKPAEQTTGIARILFDILHEAGAPEDVLHFLPGRGETVGVQLVSDPRVALIAFTGSKAVGLNIIETAGLTSEAQNQVKKVVCEMGGKNAIIVDASADLDEAVLGVRSSAFGFQGQKCSACSRCIVVDETWDEFLERFLGATEALIIGDPRSSSTDVGPVIDKDAAAMIQQRIEQAKKEDTLLLGMELPEEGLMPDRSYIAPHVFVTDDPKSKLMQEEIFGPVLGLIRARDFDHALALANDGRYRLTGGVYSRKPAHLTQARREFRVGNLYLNRSITGAIVGRQPFGGAGMSGVGSKAGGRDYLLQFVEPRVITENTMRRGFAPGLG
ncbi:MAG: 1-pyrroline-5-carboxylate dehydrogenase [Phycisphaerae bacterium]|jgi:RHH-type proline utilization regulon transcriptional repressor/proline dehydrogenase/delta 1-pyrroline-5-carboxylate dehydrogenase|nr:1-pyrroline-5-carboxylate dehydrogenase [Phycisphaerae bacterium]